MFFLTAAVAASLVSIAYAASFYAIDLERDFAQSLSISDEDQSGLDLSDTLTLEAWVKFESTPGREYFIMKRNGAGNQRSWSWFLNDANTVALDWQSDGTTGTFANFSWSPIKDTWYHIAVTKEGTTVKFYVNGVQIGGTQNGSFSEIYNGSAPVEIGQFTELAHEGNSFDGQIDNVRIWNVARTPEEIADNMNAELTGNESGLVAYWKFDGLTSAGDVKDATANNNDLTINNGAQLVKSKRKIDKIKNK